jgi:GNAT superfamily N-acetyltransferase
MTTYRMMDETCLLASCLHGGPVRLPSLREALTTAAYAEREEGLPPGALARFLQALCQRYGSAAVLAVEGDLVVGKLRFAPRQVERMLSGICFQQAAEARRIAELDLETLPAREDLARQELRLDCSQVAPGHSGRGIAKGLLDQALSWARAAGWETVSSSAIRHIPPLLNWSGQASAKALRERGFVVVSESASAGLREGVVSQRQGYHGEDVQRQWEEFAHRSDDDAATLYEMTLDLRG